jgi:hypothetical protein
MPRPGLLAAWVLTGLSLAFSGATSAGERRFQGPLTINDVPLPVGLDAGDFNTDGKLDLVAASGSGPPQIVLQDPLDRTSWSRSPLQGRSGGYFVRAADFDGDGQDDLAVADPGSTAYFVHGNGDGTFANPKALPARARWITVGDWDGDGDLDLATDQSDVSIRLGDGNGNFSLGQTIAASAHAIEAVDYDGDGRADLAVGWATGITLLRNVGAGRFDAKRGPISTFGPVRTMAVGDLNGDGKGDLAVTWDESSTVAAGVSRGNGEYQRTLLVSYSAPQTPAIGDLNGDGKEDLVMTTRRSPGLSVYLGAGDGTFLKQPVLFGPIGLGPMFFLGRDLDGDRRLDAIAAETEASSLTLFWGREGEQFLESGGVITGSEPGKAFALADFHRGGKTDFFFASSAVPEVLVYLDLGVGGASAPSLKVPTALLYSSLEVVDLDGDGVLDLAGTESSGSLGIEILRADGSVREELVLPAGTLPTAVASGKVDEGDTLDLIVAASGSNQILVFPGLGGGKFGEARAVPTVDYPKKVVVGDLDQDGTTDLVVVSYSAIAVHYGMGGGDFSQPAILAGNGLRTYLDASIADLDGDALPDLVMLNASTKSALILRGKGGREFEEPSPILLGTSRPSSLLLFDVDGDGLLDITTSSSTQRSVSILLNKGSAAFLEPEVYGVGIAVIGHRFADLDLDGALDLVAVSSTSAAILQGRKQQPPPEARFRRGDVDGDGVVGLSDAVLILEWLFRGGPLPACADAADADDSGTVNLTDAIRILRWLLQGGEPPPAPGPASCGADPTPDGLTPCARTCI